MAEAREELVPRGMAATRWRLPSSRVLPQDELPRTAGLHKVVVLRSPQDQSRVEQHRIAGVLDTVTSRPATSILSPSQALHGCKLEQPLPIAAATTALDSAAKSPSEMEPVNQMTGAARSKQCVKPWGPAASPRNHMYAESAALPRCTPRSRSALECKVPSPIVTDLPAHSLRSSPESSPVGLAHSRSGTLPLISCQSPEPGTRRDTPRFVKRLAEEQTKQLEFEDQVPNASAKPGLAPSQLRPASTPLSVQFDGKPSPSQGLRQHEEVKPLEDWDEEDVIEWIARFSPVSADLGQLVHSNAISGAVFATLTEGDAAGLTEKFGYRRVLLRAADALRAKLAEGRVPGGPSPAAPAPAGASAGSPTAPAPCPPAAQMRVTWQSVSMQWTHREMSQCSSQWSLYASSPPRAQAAADPVLHPLSMAPLAATPAERRAPILQADRTEMMSPAGTFRTSSLVVQQGAVACRSTLPPGRDGFPLVGSQSCRSLLISNEGLSLGMRHERTEHYQ